jgi:hypothetical protein
MTQLYWAESQHAKPRWEGQGRVSTTISFISCWWQTDDHYGTCEVMKSLWSTAHGNYGISRPAEGDDYIRLYIQPTPNSESSCRGAQRTDGGLARRIQKVLNI